MRQRLLTMGMAAALLVLGVSADAAQKTDFSGNWVLDKSRSEGLPPSVTNQTMTVNQTGDRVEVVANVSSSQGDQEITDLFVLDGKETEFTPPVMNGRPAAKGKRTSKWSADGKAFDVVEEATVEGPEGAVKVKATRHWQLSEDGQSLTSELTFEGPMGVRKAKRVFVKK